MIIKILWIFSLIAILNGLGLGIRLEEDEDIETVSDNKYMVLVIFSIINLIGIGHVIIQCILGVL